MTRDPSSLFSPPESIGPYRILHQVGAGVLGPVFRALDPGQERMVGIKLFRLDITPEQAAALAERLAELVDRLPDHDGLVRPLAAGMEGTSAFLVTDYVAADSIDQRLRRKAPSPFDQTLPLLEQAGAALDAAALAGQYHGALHPRDVLVSTRGDVSITGVGVMQALEAVGFRPPFRRPYAAPERLAGRTWDARADVFTLAVLALELVTGRRPLMPESAAALQWVDALEPARAPAVRAVLASALEEEPSRRDPSASQWVARLAGALQGELAEPAGDDPVEAPPFREPPVEARSTIAPGPNAADPLDLRFERADDRDREAPEQASFDLPLGSAGEVSGERSEAAGPGPAWWDPLEGFASEKTAEDSSEEDRPQGATDPSDAFARDRRLPESSPAGGDPRSSEDALASGGSRAATARAERGPQADGPQALGDSPGIEPPQQVVADDVHDSRGAPPSEAAVRSAGARRDAARTASGPVADQVVPSRGARPKDVPRRGRAIMLFLVAACLVAGVGLGYWLGIRQDAAGPSDQLPRSSASEASDRMTDETEGVVTLEEPELAPEADAADRPRGAAAATPPDGAPARRTVSPTRRESPAASPNSRARPNAGTSEATPASLPQREGRMLIRSTPAGAQVMVNGEPRGLTPLALRDLDYGRYRVALLLGGYTPSEREIWITREAPAKALTFDLVRGAGPGPSTPAEPALASPGAAAPAAPGREASLEIVSRPDGARVVLNGQFLGNTPLRVAGLAAGTHEIRLERDGYRVWSGSVSAPGGRLTRVAASLEVSIER